MQSFEGAVFGGKLNIEKRPFVKIDFDFALIFIGASLWIRELRIMF
ncbi:hypothetical protein [Maritalea sp. S77]